MHAATGAEAPSRLPAGLTITGDLSSDQDLVIDGVFDGQITLPEQHVTINESARVKGRIIARAVMIAGVFEGAVVATGQVSLTGSAAVRAHLQTPSLVMNEGARFDGSVDPARSEAATHVAKYRQKQAEGA